MAQRQFKITLPADTNNHNLYSLIVGQVSNTNIRGYGATEGGTNETGITGAIPQDGVLPDRGNYLQVMPDNGNTGNIIINDRNFANSTGPSYPKNVAYVESGFSVNCISFKDVFLQGSAASQICEVTLGWT